MRLGKFIRTIITERRIIPIVIPKRIVNPEEKPIPVQIPKREPALVPAVPGRKK